MNIRKIKEKMNKQELSLYKLSVKSGIGYSTLHDLIITGKDTNPKINTIIKIADCLGEKVENLL